MSSEVIIGRRGEATLRLGRCSRCGLSPLPRRSLGCPWVPATSSAATWTCPTADHPKGKDSRLYGPVRRIPQTHKGKLPPSLTVDFRVRLAAAALRTRTCPGTTGMASTPASTASAARRNPTCWKTAAISRRPGPGGFVRLLAWLSRRW